MLERAYQVFVRCRDIVASAEDEQGLLDAVCHLTVDELGFRFAWVGLVSDQSPEVKPAAQAGYEDGYLSSLHIEWAHGPRAQGPTGRAVRERTPQVARDIASDQTFEPWRADALARGYGSSASLPLFDGIACVGTLNLYATEPDAFDDAELALLEDVAVELAMGISRLRSRAQLASLTERTEATSVAIGAVAHEMADLLQTATLSLSLALEASDADQRRDLLDDALRANSLVGAMTKRLMTLARHSADCMQHAQVDRVIRRAEHLIRRLAPRANLALTLGAQNVGASVSSLDVERIVINLVVNADQAIDDGGYVSIRTRVTSEGQPIASVQQTQLPPGRYLALSVSDDGPGIPADVLPRIFDPYFTTKGATAGGLGLAAVRDMARAAGGEVTVTTSADAGTTFTVWLPTVDAAT